MVEELAKAAGDLPIVLGGDFNTTEKSRGYYTYRYLVGPAGYKDARYAAPENATDNSGTARIWGKDLNNNGSRIDYIFVNDKCKVCGTHVPNIGVSDHLPVVADLEI